MSKHRWNKESSRRAVEAKARKRMSGTSPDYFDRPEAGLLLHTIRVESHLGGLGFEIKVRQGDRLNQIIAETFGRKSKPHGLDWLAKSLRKKLVTRWL